MYDKQIAELKKVIRGKLVIDNPDNMGHLNKDFEKILDILYEDTYEEAYAQGFDEGETQGKKHRYE